MNQKYAVQFAQWLQVTHPDIFVSILKHAQPVNAPLGDWTDVLSSVGDAASSAVSAVGNFVSNPQNVQALSSVATAYFKSQLHRQCARMRRVRFSIHSCSVLRQVYRRLRLDTRTGNRFICKAAVNMR